MLDENKERFIIQDQWVARQSIVDADLDEEPVSDAIQIVNKFTLIYGETNLE